MDGVDHLTIRAATVDDAPALAAIAVAGFAVYRSFAGPEYLPPGVDEETERLRRVVGRDGAWCEVACHAEAPVAFAGLARPARPGPDGILPDPAVTAHLWALFVLEPFWGGGVARRLHADAVAEAARRGCTDMRLFTPAGAGRARRFYERERWTPRGGVYFEPALGLDLVEYRRGVE